VSKLAPDTSTGSQCIDKDIDLGLDLCVCPQSGNEVRGEPAHPMCCAHNSAKHGPASHVLAARVCVGEQRLLDAVRVGVGKLQHGRKRAAQIASRHGVLSPTRAHQPLDVDAGLSTRGTHSGLEVLTLHQRD